MPSIAPRAAVNVVHATSPILSQGKNALGLKMLVKKMFDVAAKKGGACVIKVAANLASSSSVSCTGWS
ncbi:hypothetical protein H9P43_009145 [Blastocladiella emersonii ATCC 22665]|nr:hypothetical protein H9P43_009145 [Blastocladiella emersonii ATCC 22665]